MNGPASVIASAAMNGCRTIEMMWEGLMTAPESSWVIAPNVHYSPDAESGAFSAHPQPAPVRSTCQSENSSISVADNRDLISAVLAGGRQTADGEFRCGP